jgi:hypothetical protein
MNVEPVEQARATIEALPLVTGSYAKYDFMQVGPLPRWAFCSRENRSCQIGAARLKAMKPIILVAGATGAHT